MLFLFVGTALGAPKLEVTLQRVREFHRWWFRPVLKMTITNHTKSEIRVWSTGTSWGDFNTTFEVQGRRGAGEIKRGHRAYTMNFPRTETVGRGKSLVRTVDLADGSWACSPGLRWREKVALRCNYHLPEGPYAQGSRVVTGEWKSNWVEYRLPMPR